MEYIPMNFLTTKTEPEDGCELVECDKCNRKFEVPFETMDEIECGDTYNETNKYVCEECAGTDSTEDSVDDSNTNDDVKNEINTTLGN